MVLIDQLNIDATLKARLSSAFESFRKAKESSLTLSKITQENKSIVEKEQAVISSGKIRNIIEEEQTVIPTEKVRSKLSEFINNFMYSDYEAS